MKVHNIWIETFCHEGDLKIGQSVLGDLLPTDTEIQKDVIEPELEGDVFKAPLIALRAKIEKTKDITEFLGKIRENLGSGDRDLLLNEVRERIDDHCNFYIRLSKKELGEGRFVLQSADSVHIKIRPAVYPAKKDNAVDAVTRWLG